MDIYTTLFNEEIIRGERTAWIFRWILYTMVCSLAAIVYFGQDHTAGLFGMLFSITPVLYNLFLYPLIRQKRTYTWIRYVSVTIDIMGLSLYNLGDTIFTSTLVPVTTATLLLYPTIIFLASLRLDRKLIMYTTVLSVITMNILYAWAYPKFNPSITPYIVSADIPGQMYRTLYILLCGGLILFVPNTIKRLLKNQRDIFMDNKKNFELSRKDNLTGLPNRRVLEHQLSQDIAFAEINNKRLAILYLDLDRFKPVNDEYGHDIGDLVLKETAKRLTSSIRDNDLAIRVGGDEFVIILNKVENKWKCDQLALRISENIEQPIYIDDLEIKIGVSIGLALFPEDASTADDLIEKADRIMLASKKEKR